MAERNEMSIGVVLVGDAGKVVVTGGEATTRAGVLADSIAKDLPVGSLYLSSAGKAYLRVAAAGAETDWQKVTTSAAD